ncbi:MAG: hypothetical protein KF754_15265 [Planctomycetes bacterium]|nr:hypothetical protein [Planctomycetota bacterium]
MGNFKTSTWVALAVLVALIFVPAMFIDVENMRHNTAPDSNGLDAPPAHHLLPPANTPPRTPPEPFVPPANHPVD